MGQTSRSKLRCREAKCLVYGLGIRVYGLEFRIYGLGFRVVGFTPDQKKRGHSLCVGFGS